tara:strand:- start:35 stop:529 length:495 start_codon:yes stop_codon:yes gene_type:complete
MAFKMTPGMKGNPAAKRVAGLGACGGPGQQPCEPRFEKEVKEEKRMRAIDRSSSSISKSIKPKIKAVPVKPAPAPVKLQINLPKGYEFKSKMAKAIFYDKFSDLSGFKSQEELDMAIMKQLKEGGPKDPKDPGGPVFEGPVLEGPVLEGPVVVEPIKGVGVIKK